jgi:hypothetical protein
LQGYLYPCGARHSTIPVVSRSGLLPSLISNQVVIQLTCVRMGKL